MKSSLIGNELRDIRKQRGYTQAELSAMCDWGDTNVRISKIEQNKQPVNERDLKKLSDALGFDFFAVVNKKSAPASAKMIPCIHPVDVVCYLRSSHEVGALTYRNDLPYREHYANLFDLSEFAFYYSMPNDSLWPPISKGTTLLIDPGVPFRENFTYSTQLITCWIIGDKFYIGRYDDFNGPRLTFEDDAKFEPKIINPDIDKYAGVVKFVVHSLYSKELENQ